MQSRFVQVLNSMLQQTAVSIALHEETELICAVVLQLFEHANVWAEVDLNTFSKIRDCLLFAVPQFLLQVKSAQPCSQTEQYLQSKASGMKSLL